MWSQSVLLALHILCSSTVHSSIGFSDPFHMMKIKAMKHQFDLDSIDGEQQVSLLKYAGYKDLELFQSGALSSDEWKKSFKKVWKNDMIQQMLEQGSIDLSHPLWRQMFFEDDKDYILTLNMKEPLKSIIRLIRSDDQLEQDYGHKLMKKWQYKKLNRPGSVMSENLDEILLSDDRPHTIKHILQHTMIDQLDHNSLEHSIMYYFWKSREETDPIKLAEYKSHMKDLSTIQLFQSAVPSQSPVTKDNLYMFYQLTNGKIDPSDLLNVAHGNEIGPINEQEFEYYFGSSAKQFSCRAHTDTLKTECGINLKQDECIAEGCCYLPEPGPPPGQPKCFHDIYGQISSSIVRKAWVNDNIAMSDAIKNLFRDNEIPTLDKILRDEATPYATKLWTWDNVNDVYNPGEFNTIQYPNKNWWDVSKLSTFEPGPNGEVRDAFLWNQKDEDRPRYGRPGFEWKPHGPTQSPFFDELPGVNPTANPLNNGFGTLADYYKMWLTYSAYQDQAQCALIPDTNRVKCMKDFKALVDEVHGNGVCEAAGCCFNEDAFLAGKDACYRATEYGTCKNLPTNFLKTECGAPGITETECLTNVQCCYEPSANPSTPWCFRKFSATIEEDGWCELWKDEKYRFEPRDPCFDVGTKDNFLTKTDKSDINNLVSEEQCLAAKCCYDESLDWEKQEWLTKGLGNTNAQLYRCFRKSNPMITISLHFDDYTGPPLVNPQNGQIAPYLEIEQNYDIDSDYTDSVYWTGPGGTGAMKENPHEWETRKLTCDVADWSMGNQGKFFKRSCGEGLSYYQCVYQKGCCYMPTVINEPVCYKPEYEWSPQWSP